MRARRALVAFAVLAASFAALPSTTADAGTATTGSSAQFVLAVDGSQASLDTFDQATPQITVSTGANMPTSLRQWISGTLQNSPTRKDGAVHTCAYDGRIVSTLSFKQGLLGEVDFPALDGGSKDPARITLKISPQSTATQQGSGSATVSTTPADKAWLVSNFKLTVDGIDASHVQKVDPIVVAGPQPVKLVVWTPQGQAPAFSVWARTPGKTKNGQLDYLAPDVKTKLLGLRLSNMTVVGVTNATPPGATTPMTRVEMNVGSVGIQ